MKTYTRRQFTKIALAAIPAVGAISTFASRASAAGAGKVNSKVNGVQIGLNVPYSFGGRVMNGDEILANCLQVGVNGLELRTQAVELFLGAPAAILASGRGAANNATALRDWRAKADPKRAVEFRKKYEDAGMKIEILKLDNTYSLADAELDYVFTLAKSLGARAISTEIAAIDDEAKRNVDHKRLAGFADRHEVYVGIHGHEKVTPDHWEAAISLSKYMGINLDLGHFIAGNNYSPIDYLKKRHDRITHIHVKDRKKNMGPNVPFGEGDTPVVEALRLMRDNKWTFQATIEFEYPVPAGSDRMAEITKSVKFCRDALA